MNVTIEKIKLSEIKINPDNPRQISEKQMERLVKSLQEFPEMMELREIVVDENMMILGGNMRYLALKEAGEQECIAKIVSGLTDEQKREFIVKDNAQFGEWDLDALGNAWDDLPLAEWGVDIPKSWGDLPGGPPMDDPDLDSEKPQIIICPKCQHEFSVLKEQK